MLEKAARARQLQDRLQSIELAKICVDDFYEFRKAINKKFIEGWWQKEVANHLQKFAEDMASGLSPILVLEAPPQHGKSTQVIDFIAWMAGKWPHLKKIYASFSERLGIRANLRLQRIFTSPKYKMIFPETGINESSSIAEKSRFLRNREMLEYVNHEGSFRNTTVNGAVTGESLDVGIIDDPLKGREAANSDAIRNKTWDWFTDDFFTRFSEHAGLLFVLTRWHVDDPIGRLRERFDESEIRVLKYPAIATVAGENGRQEGEALFPEHKSAKFLLKRKGLMAASSWESLYMQNPTVPGGSMLKISKIKFYDDLPNDIIKGVRYWDLAATEPHRKNKDPDFTAGAKLYERDGRYYLHDMRHFRKDIAEVEQALHDTAQQDGADFPVFVEEEGGASGKGYINTLSRLLVGYIFKGNKKRMNKVSAAVILESAIDNGNFYVRRAPWTQNFVDECEVFPNGKHDDMVDAVTGGMEMINDRPVYAPRPEVEFVGM